jgi:putative transposase
MSRTGNCYDNSVVESFFSTLEFELRQYCQFDTLRQAHWSISDYIDNYYNAKRMHSTLDYASPIEYEQHLAVAI